MSFVCMVLDEKKQQIVLNEELKGKTVVFYKDDCLDCRQMYPRFWLRQQLRQDIVFVNMNQPLNRHYIHEFHLRQVPTIQVVNHGGMRR